MADKTLLERTADCFSVKSPAGHWWYQRVAAVALLPLSVWLLVFLNQAQHAAYTEIVAWLSSPINALAIGAWSVTAVYHAALGVQVVMEDYVSDIRRRHLAIRITNLVFLSIGLAALLAIIIILIR